MSVGTASGRSSRTRSVYFGASGTWTVPAGVFYAEAEVVGGGGGIEDITGNAGSTQFGSDSSVAFTGQTITAKGQAAYGVAQASYASYANDAPDGYGASPVLSNSSIGIGSYQDILKVHGGASVTPGASITVTVGAGRADVKGDGGDGYVLITYEV